VLAAAAAVLVGCLRSTLSYWRCLLMGDFHCLCHQYP